MSKVGDGEAFYGGCSPGGGNAHAHVCSSGVDDGVGSAPGGTQGHALGHLDTSRIGRSRRYLCICSRRHLDLVTSRGCINGSLDT